MGVLDFDIPIDANFSGSCGYFLKGCSKLR